MVELAIFVLALAIGAGAAWLVATDGDEKHQALTRRNENLRAALASVEARLHRALSDGIVPHPLRQELGLVRAACQGALEADDPEAEKAKR